ncbi:hypothetical protein FACS189475_03960 [Betaproteobacteria bacterium]|nr:hypothetical protein FACS189475_03960 [Betaproteobacteria bacterium]
MGDSECIRIRGKILSNVLLADMEEIAADRGIPWEELCDSTVLITGATGTIGSALVRDLYAASKKHGLGARILAFGRNKEKAKPLTEDCGAEFIAQDVCEPLAVAESVDYIFHCAAVNIVNPAASVTIREMAEWVACEVCGGKISVVVEKPLDIENAGMDPPLRENSARRKKLCWKPRHGLAEMYRRLILD